MTHNSSHNRSSSNLNSVHFFELFRPKNRSVFWAWLSCLLLGMLIFSSCRKQTPAPAESSLPAAKTHTDMILYASGGNFFLTDLEGNPARKITSGSSDWFPAVSPDFGRVAYWSNAGGTYELWLLDMASGRKQQLTFFNDQAVPAGLQNFNVHNAPSWSPDGTQLVFSRSGVIWSIESSGFNLQTVVAGGFHYAPAWSPDGTQLAYVSKRQKTHNLYVRKWGSEEEWNLTNFPSAQAVGGPAWSPDGQVLVFSLSAQQDVDVWSIRADGTLLTRITRDRHSNSPAWSPDGKKLAISSGRQDPYRWEIWVMNPDGSGAFAVTRNSGFSPVWLRQAKIPATAVPSQTPKPTAVFTAALPTPLAPTPQPTRAVIQQAATAVPTPSPVVTAIMAKAATTVPATAKPTSTATAVPAQVQSTATVTAVAKFEDDYEDFEEYADADKAILPAGDVNVENKKNQIIFNPKLDFYFAKDMIKSSSLEALHQLGEELNKYPDSPLVVRCEIKGFKSLKKFLPLLKNLSRARANSVLRHLIVTEKIKQINVTALGEDDPMTDLGKLPAEQPLLLVIVQ